MSSKPSNKEHRGRRRRRPRRSETPQRPDRPKPNCGICEEPITDVITALSRPSDGAAVHFNCALAAVKENLNPRDGEQIVYLGKGTFAVVDQAAYKQQELKIIRSTAWEDPEKPGAWRRDLQTDIY